MTVFWDIALSSLMEIADVPEMLPETSVIF
jgi:hypothetical protein